MTIPTVGRVGSKTRRPVGAQPPERSFQSIEIAEVARLL